jgi:tetratricopeptide (TPR) repeat protein
MPLAAELRARVALALGDRNLATQRLREALQLIPDADDLRVELARQRFRAGYFAEAGSEFSRLAARAEGAEFSYASYWAGIAYALAGRCAPALAALQAVFDASGGRDGWAMLGLARLGALCPVDPALRAQSLAWAENLYRQHPGVETAVTMALHAAAQGDFAQAVHLQQEAVTLATTNQETHEHLASLKTVLGSYQAKTMPDKAYLPGSGLLNIE